ncbi:DinB family protein [Longimicrobium terrae]|uniref:Putative damage-inducible protein DinB n=1 Tax=Longimicrobium terrae TaxID=1639882 RepID=A0A841H1M1_9BACT|nr:DinB family protein [Longimicrobium terrae]MBB4637470.1 putative damage-inducible protein DinB [Longimicrobium terrae]MBB6071868.1 putative damage-inducible protein DinB [Longimicrobium terrae]NNC30417.1 damage-inducible protein DinB [Longimicrobium terrae]
MTIQEILVRELDAEVGYTRQMLERVPMDRQDFAPHERSMPLGRLAAHVASLLSLASQMMQADFLDFNTVDPASYSRVHDSTASLLAELDKEADAARAALRSATDEQLQATWTLRAGDDVFFALPRWEVYRRFTMNHLVHHRAQIAVYLRMLNVTVPGMYGPSADEM